ncbi:MAG: hypothetical protein ABR575_02020 [Actinomycetota bacterium]
MDEIGPVAAVRLVDTEGREVVLGDLWKDRPVVLVWLRHYG